MNNAYLKELKNFFYDNKKILKILDFYEKYDKKDYLESDDFQILDISFEYNFITNKSNFSRFSLFGLKKNFLDNLGFLGIDFSDFFLFYDKNKKNLKDNFITISFEFLGKNISKIKIYFDILKGKEVILKSISIGQDGFQEKKDYFDNGNLKKYLGKYKPFDILYRKNNSGELISIKYYFKKDTKENISLIENFRKKYFYDLIFSNYNYQDEIGIDFDLSGKIQKITFYRGIYKDEKNLNRSYNFKSMQ